MEKVPKLTRLEWKTIKWMLHHGGSYRQCGMDEKQIDRLRKKLKMEETEVEWVESIVKGGN